VTGEIVRWLAAQNVAAGLLTVYLPHSSASLLIQENAAPDVRADLQDFLRDLAPEERNWRHDDEGPDDMPAHARAALLPVQLSIPVSGSRLQLGTWQGVYLVEHRKRPHRRELVLHFMGE
jgi:secondary thiamine-phosphate synthase enzyme